MFDDRNVSSENQIKLWQYYNDTLAKGVDVGYSPTPEMYDPKLAHSLKYDVAKFSAFKETSFRKQLEAALTKDGKIVPWSEFKKTADALHIDYNRRWLKTEYNHTVATANMAEQWQEFEADKDLYPNLKYVTAGDARVRDAHKILDGLILPINHPFWKSHTAPLDWGCRCHIEQSDDEPSKIIPTYKVKEEFQNNAFHSGKIFNGSAYESGLSNSEAGEANILANTFSKEVRKQKDIEIKEWAKTTIPEGGNNISLPNFKTGSALLYRKNIKSIGDHFTEPHLKDMAMKIIPICKSCKFKSYASIEDSLIVKTLPNIEKKKLRGVTGFNYYEFEYEKEVYRLNVEIIDSKEYPVSINKIINAE